MSRVLVIGYGNPGRRDDGLGPAAADALGKLRLPDVTVDADYQLTVEDAAAVAQHDVAVFIDAACDGAEPFRFVPLTPGDTVSFSTHSVGPDGVLALAQSLFHARTQAYVLGIRGYEFNEFGEGLSDSAAQNLSAALSFVEPVIRDRTFREAAASPEKSPNEAAPHPGD
jgi:hydrogenase maturation protease